MGGGVAIWQGKDVDKAYRTHKKRTNLTNQYLQTFSLPAKSPKAFFLCQKPPFAASQMGCRSTEQGKERWYTS